MVHDPKGGSEHNVPEATGWEDILHPLLNVRHCDIESGGDNSALVDAANELHHNLAGAVVVDHLELANVACTQRRRVELVYWLLN